MDNLRNILIQHNYLQQDNLYIKNKKAYVSHIELTEIDDRYISFVLKRIYNSKTIELINYKRLMYKFINIIENVIINESSLDVGDSNLHSKLFHCEIYCSGCEETIIDRINSFFFCDIEGFVSIHETQFGRCIIAINKETADIIIEHLNTMKNCSDCEVLIL